MEIEMKSHVYVLCDDQNRVTRIEGQYTLPADLTGWIKIDEGYGDKYNLAQTNYLEGGLYTLDGVPRYKLADGAPALRTEDEIKADSVPAETPSDPVADLAETVAALIYQMDVDKLGGGETV